MCSKILTFPFPGSSESFSFLQVHIATSFNSVSSNSIVQVLGECLIQEDEASVHTNQHGLQLSVKTSMSRADCFEAHVGILSQIACLWLQNVFDSIKDLFDTVQVLSNTREGRYATLLQLVKDSFTQGAERSTDQGKLWQTRYEFSGFATKSTEGKHTLADQGFQGYAVSTNSEKWRLQGLFLRWDHAAYGLVLLLIQVMKACNHVILHAFCSQLEDPKEEHTAGEIVIRILNDLSRDTSYDTHRHSRKEQFRDVLYSVRVVNQAIRKHTDDKRFTLSRCSEWSLEVCLLAFLCFHSP